MAVWDHKVQKPEICLKKALDDVHIRVKHVTPVKTSSNNRRWLMLLFRNNQEDVLTSIQVCTPVSLA